VMGCSRCRQPIMTPRDSVTVTTRNGGALLPGKIRLCDGCAGRLAKWLHRCPSRPATPPAEAPPTPTADARPIRLAEASSAFLKPPTGPAGWRPSPPPA
jgi:hypothetical protein